MLHRVRELASDLCSIACVNNQPSNGEGLSKRLSLIAQRVYAPIKVDFSRFSLKTISYGIAAILVGIVVWRIGKIFYTNHKSADQPNKGTGPKNSNFALPSSTAAPTEASTKAPALAELPPPDQDNSLYRLAKNPDLIDDAAISPYFYSCSYDPSYALKMICQLPQEVFSLNLPFVMTDYCSTSRVLGDVPKELKDRIIAFEGNHPNAFITFICFSYHHVTDADLSYRCREIRKEIGTKLPIFGLALRVNILGGQLASSPTINNEENIEAFKREVLEYRKNSMNTALH